jgi:hypothetical protein
MVDSGIDSLKELEDFKSTFLLSFKFQINFSDFKAFGSTSMIPYLSEQD